MGEWREVEFGKIPLEWDFLPIIDLKSDDKHAIAMGPFGSNIKAENYVDCGVPVIRGTNFNFYKYIGGDFAYLTEEKANELKGSICRSDDLVFTHRGTIGQVGLIPSEPYSHYVISQSGMKLTTNKSIINPEFLLYFFISKFGQFQILKHEAQVGVPSISNPLTSLKQIDVPVPPLPEQKAIASVPSSLDDKIDLLHRQNKTLEAMAETLFRQWFVVEARDDWKNGKVEDLFLLQRGFDLPRQKRVKGPYPIFAASGHSGYHEEFRVKGPGVTTGRSGLLGKVFLIMEDFWPLNTSLFVKEYKIAEPLFAYFLLKRIDLEGFNAGSAVPTLNRNHVHEFNLPIPPKTLIEKFENLALPCFDKIQSNLSQIRTLEKLRNTLLPKLMSGEIRVKYDEKKEGRHEA